MEDSLSSDDMESLVRALTVPYAKGKVSKELIDLFERSDRSKDSLRWSIGNALEVVATHDEVPKMLEIVSDLKNGASRQMFVLALGKFMSEEVENTLIRLLENDDEVLGHVISALGKLKSENAKEKIEGYLNHPKNYIRKQAVKTVKQINKG